MSSPVSLGAFYAVLSYLIWGLSPVFWKQFQAFSPWQILAYRVLWSCVILLIFGVFAKDLVKHGIQRLRDPKILLWTFVATVLIGSNWFTYIWAVGQNRIVEASLGYYLNPIGNILIGVLFFKERLNLFRWLAFALALSAVTVLLFNHGKLPWVSLVLAASFALYGMLKKWMRMDAAFALGCETLLLLPLAIPLVFSTESARVQLSSLDHLWFFCAGMVTLIPLFTFAKAAQLLPYSTLGFFQYLAPSLQLFCAVVLYDEPFEKSRQLAFLLIWVSLLMITYETFRNSICRRL